MADTFHHLGKQVLMDGQHYADACTPEAAAAIASALCDRTSIATYLDNQADIRGRHLGRALKVMASNVRAGLDQVETDETPGGI